MAGELESIGEGSRPSFQDTSTRKALALTGMHGDGHWLRVALSATASLNLVHCCCELGDHHLNSLQHSLTPFPKLLPTSPHLFNQPLYSALSHPSG